MFNALVNIEHLSTKSPTRGLGAWCGPGIHHTPCRTEGSIAGRDSTQRLTSRTEGCRSRHPKGSAWRQCTARAPSRSQPWPQASRPTLFLPLVGSKCLRSRLCRATAARFHAIPVSAPGGRGPEIRASAAAVRFRALRRSFFGRKTK
jgi:hypothetical protein